MPQAFHAGGVKRIEVCTSPFVRFREMEIAEDALLRTVMSGPARVAGRHSSRAFDPKWVFSRPEEPYSAPLSSEAHFSLSMTETTLRYGRTVFKPILHFATPTCKDCQFPDDHSLA
jgi:hypothetical protein